MAPYFITQYCIFLTSLCLDDIHYYINSLNQCDVLYLVEISEYLLELRSSLVYDILECSDRSILWCVLLGIYTMDLFINLCDIDSFTAFSCIFLCIIKRLRYPVYVVL